VLDPVVNHLNPEVSVIIPTKNSARFLENLLESIDRQTYPSIETIVVDGDSTDGTVELAKHHGARVISFDPGVAKGKFDAPQRRNFGAEMSNGKFIYYVDADMELHPNTVQDAVELCKAGAAAVIVAEHSFGSGPWARAKTLERLTYAGDDTVEAPRFFRRSVWEELGGLDETLGGGGDDWDLHEAVREAGYRIERTRDAVLHNEGDLRLKSLLRKRYMYGQDSWRYVKKRPRAAVRSYFPIRPAYFRHWRKFAADPLTTSLLIVMRVGEYGAGFAGVLVSVVRDRRHSQPSK
jgi:glycosyltransferase involved in cell wall biosynthesis